MVAKARWLSAAAEQIDAMVLGVELMMENQRRLMRDQAVGDLLCNNELWHGIAVLLTTAREQAVAIGQAGETIEVASMSADQATAV